MDVSQQQAADMRALSMAQMQQQQGQQDARKEQMEAQRQAMEEQRNAILKASLEPEALERLRRVALVKPEKAKAAENYIIQLCKTAGAQRGLIDEDTVRTVLEKVSESGGNVGKIQFRRKKFGSDDEDDF